MLKDYKEIHQIIFREYQEYGEKTALSLIQKFGSIDNLYEKVDKGESELKGKQKENIENNRDLAYLSKTLGTINLEVPIQDKLEDFKVEEWDKPRVLELFKNLNFNRYIERFSLREENKKEEAKDLFKIVDKSKEEIIKLIKEQKEMIFYLEVKPDNDSEKIIKDQICGLSVFNSKNKEAMSIKLQTERDLEEWKDIFEDETIKKISINFNKIYILLKQIGIEIKGMSYDIAIASYILNPSNNKLEIDNLIEQYLNIDISSYVDKEEKQMNLFDMGVQTEESSKEILELYSYAIYKIKEITLQKLDEIKAKKLFDEIDMPTIEVLSDMQWNGMYVDKEELEKFGEELTNKLENLTKEIYQMAGEEFNINSTKQLGEILFEKMQLPVIKKTKNGYSTDVDVLEKLKREDPIINKILDYRQLMKLNSTYVEGLKTYINPKTKRIHSFFHQTITATRKN